MRTAAVICECNPFHYGHRHVFAEARREVDCVIAVMSGNFVQRAEAAVLDKYARAEAVLRCGADLVVELPFPWCSASAEYFASAGVFLAEQLHADALVFGASQAEPELYRQMARLLLSEEFQERFAGAYAGSTGAAQAREQCLAGYLGADAAETVRLPNDILAVEYCKAILSSGAGLQVRPVRRITAEEQPCFRSASAVREILRVSGAADAEAYLPPESAEICRREWERGRHAPPEALPALLYQQLRLTRTCRNTADGGDGVLTRLKRCADASADAAEMFACAATKKYTNARFRRAALFHLTETETEHLRERPRFTQLLAANGIGCAYLASIRRTAGVTILTKPSAAEALDASARRQYDMLCTADRLYTMCLASIPAAGEYLKRTPVILR